MKGGCDGGKSTNWSLDAGEPEAWSGDMDAKNRRLFRGSDWKVALWGAACLCASASCGMAEESDGRSTAPAARRASSGVTVKAYLFTAPDGFAFVKGQTESGVAGTYPTEAGEKLVASLSKRRGFELLQGKPLVSTAGEGKKREVKVTREFIYPTEYQPAMPGKVIDGELQSVTPATPVAFDTREIGVELSHRARRQADGMIEVDLDLRRCSFLGFVNYGKPITAKRKGAFGREVNVTLSENRIEMPVFDMKRVTTSLRVKDGEFIAIGGMMPGKEPEDRRFQPWQGGSPEAAGRNFVALIQVTAAE